MRKKHIRFYSNTYCIVVHMCGIIWCSPKIKSMKINWKVFFVFTFNIKTNSFKQGSILGIHPCMLGRIQCLYLHLQNTILGVITAYMRSHTRTHTRQAGGGVVVVRHWCRATFYHVTYSIAPQAEFNNIFLHIQTKLERCVTNID